MTGKRPAASGTARTLASGAGHRPPPGLLLPRHPGDAVRVVLAGGILVGTARLISRHRVGRTEADLFRLLNHLPGGAYPLVWPIMQLGNIVAVPVVAGAAALARRYRLAAELAVTGTAVWFLAKVAKSFVPRDRPAALLPQVILHGPAATGMGYPSGHAAVACAMATLLAPYLSRRGQHAVWAVAVLVCLSRVYVGAHFPLDVLGGAALGWGTASAVHLVLGAPSGRPSETGVRRVLERLGFQPVALTPVGLDSGRSACFQARTATGKVLFVKILPRERRHRDVVYRAWRRLRHGPGEGLLRSPAHAAEQHSALALLARAGGARVPDVLAAGSYGSGSGVLVQDWVDADPLDAASAPSALLDLWRQVAALRTVRLAHGSLDPASLLVDRDGAVWLVDFDTARAPATPEALDGDAADLLAVLIPLVGAQAAAESARTVLGADVLAKAPAR